MLDLINSIAGVDERNVAGTEKSYSLSPLQQGMLFHSLESQESGVDIEQIVCILQEVLKIPQLLRAWQCVVERHPILRSSFRWEGLSEPLQDVHCRVDLPVKQLDWSKFTVAEQEEHWSALLASDRRRGFDLTQPPLMRLTLVLCGDPAYRFLWTFHHILLDGRSFPLVLREVFAFYEAFRDGQDIEIPQPRPYHDYITWLSSQNLARAERYWRQALKGFRASTQFRLPRAPENDLEAEQSYGAQEVRLSIETTARLKAFAQNHHLTVNTLLQGAWAVLLQHYSGEQDIVFGATRACRRSALADADSMVGLFINTLPMRVQVQPNMRLIDWLQVLRDQQIALREYEHTPLVKVQAWSEVPRGTPLFESLVVFENYSLDTALRASGGAWVNRGFQYIGQTNYPLTIVAYADAELLLRVEYDRRQFDQETAKRMLGHLSTLLEGMVSDPDQQLWELPVVTRNEEKLLLSCWDRGSIRYPKADCLHHQFERQVKQTPFAVAVTCDGQSLTYRSLNCRANRLAYRLRTHNVGPDTLVGLCVERSIEMIVGMLAILKAGGAYVPLDPSYPKDRLAFMLEDSGVSILLTQQHLGSGLPQHEANVVYLDADSVGASASDTSEDANPDSGARPDNLAYVIYTSGSTGKPKGTRITHYNVVRLFQSTDDWLHFNSSDVWTLFHSYAFDFTVWEIWGALLYGGRLVVVPYSVSRSPEEFAALIKQERVTVLNQTPSAFRQLMPNVIATVSPDQLTLRHVIFGGEALELQSLKPWIDRYGDQRPHLVNMYGITETTVHVTYRPITQADLSSGVGSIIGKPIPDLRVYVLNQHRKLVPIGIAGEMYVGGAGVARGYLQRPELTAERFIPDPFSNEPTAKLYRSGDLARWLPNGDLEYLGRIDQQVKIRGFRVELGEIESVLSQHPSVREAVVVARDDTPGDPSASLGTGKRLVAYFVAEDGVVIDDIRSRIQAMLPEYMVPSAFVRLPSLPLTQNGKVDRRALPIPDQARPELSQRYVAPDTPVEKTLSQIWGTVLGVKDVGIHDNFFELGGDSILSIQVIARARQSGLQLTARDLFKRPTVAELATTCTTLRSIQPEQDQVTGAVSLTPIQHWFFEQNLPQVHHWNQAFLFETLVELDLTILEGALQHVVKHHDAFRLRFKKDSSAWHQFYAEDSENVSLTRIDLSALPHTEQEQALLSAATNLQAMLNLSEGPIVRAAHFALGSHSPGRLLLIIHHLVVDGVSWRVLMEDLEAAYGAFRDERTVPLPPKTTSFQIWSDRLRELARQPALREELNYWLSVSDIRRTQIPIEVGPRRINLEVSAQTVNVRLSREETRALLQQVPAAYHTQIDDVLLTALGQCLSTWTGADSLLVDVERHGREDIADDIDLSRTIGWFTTIFPVRLDLRPGEGLPDTLKRVKEQLRQIPHHGLGYGVLRYLSDDPTVAKTLRSVPEAEVSFNYLGQFDQVLSGSALFRFAEESCGPWHSPQGKRRHLLEVLALVSNGCFEARWVYSQNMHRRETIEHLAENFLSTLRSIITYSGRSEIGGYIPSDFPLAKLDQQSLNQVLRNYTEVEDLYPLSPMQRLFYSMEAAQSRLGFEQWRYTLHGPLEVEALKHAWEQVIRRHTILRTAFIAEGLQEPLQVVLRRAQFPWTEHDWRALSPAAQEEGLTSTLQADRELGFDLATPPLIRLTLIRTTEDTYHFIWSTHHLLIDGWSWSLIFKDLSAFYDASQRGQKDQLGDVCPYRNYIAWLQEKSESDSESFWRRQLEGVTAPTSLPISHRQPETISEPEVFGEEHAKLPTSTTLMLQSLSRTHQLTMNTVIQGIWALLLSRYSGVRDVLFGAAFSGRSPEVSGIETMVGPCVNNIPVRVRIRPEAQLLAWLKYLQKEQFCASEHQYSSLLQIQGWSEIPWRLRLFESLLVFQNYVVDDATHRLGSLVEIRTVAVPETTNYPITVTVVPGAELLLRILYHREQFSSESISSVLRDLRVLLDTAAAHPTRSLSEIVSVLPTIPASDIISPVAPAFGGHGRLGSVNTDLAPRTDVEQIIAAIWRNLFQLEQVNVEDNFFDLGGHSLLLVQMHGKLQQALNRTLPIVTLFQYPTVRSLARHLSQESVVPQQTPEDFQNRAKRQREALLALPKRTARSS